PPASSAATASRPASTGIRCRRRRRRASSARVRGPSATTMSVLARRSGVALAAQVRPRVGGAAVQAQRLLLHHRGGPAGTGAQLVAVAQLVAGLVVDHVFTVDVHRIAGYRAQ